MMERLIHSRLNRVMSIILVGSAALYGVASHSPAQAEAYNLSPTEKYCMADAYLLEPGNSLPQDALNCTANDVEITRVVPTDPNAECNLGETFSFQADVTVRTNANERYDTTFYLPLTEASPQVVQGGLRNCSMILPVPAGSGETADAQIDGDACGDITKALGPDEYTLVDETITMLCTDDDGDNRADFTYCAAWDNIERDNCTIDEDPYAGQIPNTKSKCNCDTFNIDVFIKPTPPDIIKSEGSPTSRPEPGGEYTFNLSFTNPNAQTSLFISAISDEIDIDGDGTYDESLDLWSAGGSAGSSDGVYLISSNCPVGTGTPQLYEVTPSGTYSCQFTVHIVDSDLPNDQSPEFYKDVIKITLQDKNGDPVTDGETCPTGVGSADNGEYCSNEKTVQVTNLPPTISVLKTASTNEVFEPGALVTFYVTVTNTSAEYDSPLTLTSLTDTIDGIETSLDGVGTCATGGQIAFEGTYNCEFTQFVVGDQGESVTNLVTAKAIDNENDEATHSESETVSIRDVPSVVELIKTANPTEIDETGDDPNLYRDVDYTFEFTVLTVDSLGNPTVDDVTFDELVDVVDGVSTDLTSQCDALPVTLSPGESDSCTITLSIQGDAGDTRLNVATIYGTDEDGLDVYDDDDATVTFLNVPLQLTPEFAMKATAFVRIVNGGVDNMTITTMNFDGVAIVDNATDDIVNPSFVIQDLAAFSSYDDIVSPDFCSTGVVIAPGGEYECSFTIKLFPGLDPNDGSINFSLKDLDIVVADNDGSSEYATVSLTIQTAEPALP
ncbi:hypothetical protein BI375_17210 [Vibrio rotiferianus]|uniref:DUF11 domain-containing protein n=1 Tax=Vibrio rotiferianus TaxID=190895 RepID=A0ABX3DC64_9VIBR|nr:hypothetical protein [Vibrio rotiferianus]OHY94356.1 hypothetical protein BI375_17210 [Vibrio rotiferianus]